MPRTGIYLFGISCLGSVCACAAYLFNWQLMFRFCMRMCRESLMSWSWLLEILSTSHKRRWPRLRMGKIGGLIDRLGQRFCSTEDSEYALWSECISWTHCFRYSVENGRVKDRFRFRIRKDYSASGIKQAKKLRTWPDSDSLVPGIFEKLIEKNNVKVFFLFWGFPSGSVLPVAALILYTTEIKFGSHLWIWTYPFVRYCCKILNDLEGP